MILWTELSGKEDKKQQLLLEFIITKRMKICFDEYLHKVFVILKSFLLENLQSYKPNKLNKARNKTLRKL